MTSAIDPRLPATFGILGQLEVSVAGRRVDLRGRMLPRLVATLVIRAPQVCTADELIDDLWGARPPASARESLHNHVSRLRRALGEGLVVTRGNAYALAADDDQVDAARFERLVCRARPAEIRDRVTLLEQALALWRGAPLLDFRYDEFAQPEIRRLEELRVDAVEALVAARLELGASQELLPELTVLVEGFPFRERARLQLMTALHRAGRSVEALACYMDWERLLEESWDIRPGAAIRQLSSEIRATPDPGLPSA